MWVVVVMDQAGRALAPRSDAVVVRQRECVDADALHSEGVSYQELKELSVEACALGLGREWVRCVMTDEVYHNVLEQHWCGEGSEEAAAEVEGLARDGDGLCTRCSWSDVELTTLKRGGAVLSGVLRALRNAQGGACTSEDALVERAEALREARWLRPAPGALVLARDELHESVAEWPIPWEREVLVRGDLVQWHLEKLELWGAESCTEVAAQVSKVPEVVLRTMQALTPEAATHEEVSLVGVEAYALETALVLLGAPGCELGLAEALEAAGEL